MPPAVNIVLVTMRCLYISICLGWKVVEKAACFAIRINDRIDEMEIVVRAQRTLSLASRMK
jgi:hypothetical protein